MAGSENDACVCTPEKWGVEVELLAPIGSDRQQLALAIADRVGGSVRPFFHLDSEPSRVKGKPIFYHLTQAFEVVNTSGEVLLRCVDDITLQDDLDKSTLPKATWYRILSDDIRLLRLVRRHSKTAATIDESLQGVAGLFGVSVSPAEGGVYRVVDESGASIAMAAPLPGERERACELITAPLKIKETPTLENYITTAKGLGFQIPKEGATHFHFDGSFFDNPQMFLKTVRFLHQYRLVLRRMVGTNLNCRRIGDWPHEFLELIKTDELLNLSWGDCCKRLAATGVTKYCDFNIRNLIFHSPQKHTLEIRILPATLDSDYLKRILRLFNAIFSYLTSLERFEYQRFREPTPCAAMDMLADLKLLETDKDELIQSFAKACEM